MILLDDIKTAFVDKLAATGSLDAALLKATWIAYNQGLKDGRDEIVDRHGNVQRTADQRGHLPLHGDVRDDGDYLGSR